MMGSLSKKIFLSKPLPTAILAVIWGIMLGVLVLTLPPSWSFGLLIAAVVVPIVIKRPELALLGIIAISSTIMDEAYIPRVPLGPLQLYASDIIFAAVLALLVFRKISERDFKFVHSSLSWPLFAFWGIAMLATVISFTRAPGSELSLSAIFTNPPAFISEAIPEIRIVTYYLSFFLAVNVVRDKSQIKMLAYGILALSAFVVFALLSQEILGSAVKIIPGRVEELTTTGVGYIGITRVTAFSGEKLLILGLILATLLLLQEPNRIRQLLYLGLWSFILIGVLITFSRSIWGGYAIAMVFLFFGLINKEKERFVKLFLLIAVLGVLTLSILSLGTENRIKTFVNASITRALTLVNPETYLDESKDTFRWRDFEYKWAGIQIVQHPFIGLGLGAKYRPLLPSIDWTGFEGRSFVHNAHVWIMVKTGIFGGYLAFFWFSIAYIIRGLRRGRILTDPIMKAIVLGCVFTYIAVFVGSITAPMLMLYSTTPIIGIMTGLSEAVLLLNKEESSENKQQ
jgi:hypothetical protein